MRLTINKTGFTFVEIMISVIILAIVTTVWLSSFQKFFSNSQISNIKIKLENQINQEKNDLAASKISSYRITFLTWSKALFIDEDFYKNDNLIKLEIDDYNSISWSIITNNASTWVWQINTYVDYISYKSEVKSASWDSLSINLWNNKTFQTFLINSSIDDISTNNLKIVRLDYSSLDDDNIKDTIISTLSWSQSYSKVTLENIMWNKRLLANTWWTDFQADEDINVIITRWADELNFKLDK